MISRRAFVTLAGAGLLAGCTPVQQRHDLALDLVQSFKFAGIEGRIDPTLKPNWLSMRYDFLDSKGIVAPRPDLSERDAPVKEPEFPVAEFYAYLERQFTERLRRAFVDPLTREMNGARPVRVIVTLHRVDISSLGARVFRMALGGHAGDQNAIVASFDIIDAKSGQSLIRSPRVTVTGKGGEPIIEGLTPPDMFHPDPMMRMLIPLRSQFSNWLFKREHGF